jgi:amino acid transporter
MLFLAVTTIEKLKAVPPKFWWIFAGCVVGFFLGVYVLKRLLRVNKIFLILGVFVVVMFTSVSWIYNRNEPAFLTPYIDQIAVFFPTKDAYAKSENRTVVPDNTPKKPAPPPPSHVY